MLIPPKPISYYEKKNLQKQFEEDCLDELKYNQEFYQHRTESRFSDIEQSVLWSCLNDKIGDDLHSRLNSIVNKNLTMDVSVELYRGLSRREAARWEFSEVGDIIEFTRVMSFSHDFAIAKQFSGAYTYGTFCMFAIRNCPMAFNYQEAMHQMVMGAPDSEFVKGYNDQFDRLDKLTMIKDECEWMLPIRTKFRVVDVDLLAADPFQREVTIIHLECII